MWRQSVFSCLAVVIVGLFCASVGNAQEQPASGPAASEGGVVLTKLHDPEYPPIAHRGSAYGDIHLTVHVRKDGSVQSVEFVSGPFLFEKAAVESAEQSTFECRGCSEHATSYPMVYSFQLKDGDCCNTPDSADVSRSGNHVWITAEHFSFCDPAPDVIKVRSIKCLYLWKCSNR